MNLMKASSRLEQHMPWWRRKRFIVGVSLATFVNSILDLVAFALTPLSIIAPIGGVAIIASVLFARYGCAGEPETVCAVQWAAIVAVVSGVAIVTTCGPHPEPVLNTTVVLDHFHEASFMLYQFATLCALTALYAGICMRKLGGPTLETTIAAAIVSGMCSGVTQTMMKVMATCFADFAITHYLPFWHPEFWIALVELVCVAVVLLHTLNLCLASANIALATPIYQTAVLVFTITAGCAFYGDLEVASKEELYFFGLGVACVVGGISALISNRPQQTQLLPQNEPKATASTTTTAVVEMTTAECNTPLDTLDTLDVVE